MNSYFIRLSILLIFFAFIFTSTQFVHAQNNKATVNIDVLTDKQMADFLSKARSSGLSDQQIIENAIRNGMPADQAEKLRLRINRLSSTDKVIIDSTSKRSLNYLPDSLSNPTAAKTTKIQVFGSDLFSNNNLRFEPSLALATPSNYQLGPGDQLNINVSGLSQANWKLDVSPEGNINIPGSGIVNVSGKSIQQATAVIRGRLIATRYAIGNGTNLDVTLGNIRSIKVIMVGQLVRPGTYTLPSLATVFNALYSAGGPNNSGSYRKVEVIRNNRIIRHLDIYDFLAKGSQQDNINLQDQDIIRVPTYDIRVELAGEVKIPAIFEVLPGETLQNVIDFAGGFTDSAYVARIKVDQIINQERRLTDVVEGDFNNYKPLRGDKFFVEKIVDRYANRVTILGAVFRPGYYELDKGLTLAELIAKAKGLKEDAFTERGTITRLKSDNTTELISFKVNDVLNGETIRLQREDVVNIASLFDLRDSFTVTVVGAVRQPGNFAFAENMKVEDLILMAGGFSEGASSKRIEIARRSKIADSTSKAETTKIFSIDANTSLASDQGNFVLQPYDIVSVYAVPGFETQKLVRVEGEVAYPGTYAIRNREEKISDLIKRAGGLTALADVSGATLRRENQLGSNQGTLNVNEILAVRQDQAGAVSEQNAKRNNFVGINLQRILATPGTNIDLFVENADVLRVPKTEQVVKVDGEVLFPSNVVYIPGKSFRSYIDNAGSFSPRALAKRSYVIYPNGTVRSTKKFLFFKFYPSVKPGSEIYVPAKPVRTNNIQEVLGIVGGLASVAAVIFGIISISK